MDENQTLQFNGTDFTNFISFVKSMGSRDKSKTSRLALLHIENDKLICRATDDTSSFIEYSVDLYNTNSSITDFLAIPISDLSALIKCSNNDIFTIRKQFNQYEFNVIGNGWLPFKTVEADPNKFTVSGSETKIGNISSNKLRNAISSVLGYTQDYTYTRDKYIQFSKTQMIVTSRLSSVVMKDDFIEMTLHRDDAAMIKSLLKDNFDLEVYKVESAVERIMFIGPKFKFTIVASGIDLANINYIGNINEFVTIDCDELYKLVLFAEEYSASKHIVGLSIKDGKLRANVKNVLAAKHISTIRSTSVGNVADSREAEVPAHNLLKALKLFQDKRSRNVNIYITDSLLDTQKSIILFDNNTQANINIR